MLTFADAAQTFALVAGLVAALLAMAPNPFR